MSHPEPRTRRRTLGSLPSTRRFFGEADRIPGFSWFDRLHGYVYARWLYLYIAIGVGEHPIARLLGPVVRALNPRRPDPAPERRSSADGYHGKVLPVETARRLVQVMEPIAVADLERVIPYPVARALVLQDPDHLVALDCPCRAARQDSCLPLDVCRSLANRSPASPLNTILGGRAGSRAGKPTASWRRSIAGDTCSMRSSRTPCWAGSMPSATAAPAVAGQCRRIAAERRCWPHPGTAPSSIPKAAAGARPAGMPARLRRSRCRLRCRTRTRIAAWDVAFAYPRAPQAR